MFIDRFANHYAVFNNLESVVFQGTFAECYEHARELDSARRDEVSLIGALRDELNTLESVLKIRRETTAKLAERTWTPVNAKLYELSCAIERVCEDDVARKRSELIRFHLSH